MAHPIENSYHSLQLVQYEVDGNPILAGREQLHGNPFDMESKEISGPKLMFRFNPRDSDTLVAGLAAFSEMFQQLPKDKRVVFIAPGSEKFGDLGRQAVSEFSRSTGLDYRLLVFEKSEDDPSSSDGGFDGHVQDYVPVTAPDETRYLALSPQQETEIAQMVEDGAMVVALDDIFSTGATLEAIDKLLGKIGVRVNKRFAVGAEIPAEVVEIRNDVVLWKPKAGHSNQGLEVQTAFTLPLFQGMDVATIIEGDTPWHQKI